eukprot:SAG31_NODE_1961_length_6802_cov_3.762047_2_plen_296_part_00
MSSNVPALGFFQAGHLNLFQALLLGRRAREQFRALLSGDGADYGAGSDDQQLLSPGLLVDVFNLFLLLGFTINLTIMIPLYERSWRLGVFRKKRSFSLCTALEGYPTTRDYFFLPNLLVNLFLPIFVKSLLRCGGWWHGVNTIGSEGTSSNLVFEQVSALLRHQSMPFCMLVVVCVGLRKAFSTDTVRDRDAHMLGLYTAAAAAALLFASIAAAEMPTVRGGALLCAGFIFGLALALGCKKIKDDCCFGKEVGVDADGNLIWAGPPAPLMWLAAVLMAAGQWGLFFLSFGVALLV